MEARRDVRGNPPPSIAAAEEILAQGCDPRIAEVLRAWLAIHPGDRLPARSAFDPTLVPRVLPHLVLVDVERDPLRFRVRLMGTAVVAAMGEMTGHYLHERIEGFERSFAYSDRRTAAETGLPRYRKGMPSVPFKLDFADMERVHIPLAGDGRSVDVVLSVMIYHVAEKG